MKITAVIPARFAASRFPGKLLKPLGNRSVLAATYMAALEADLFDEVIIAADDKKIAEAMKPFGAKVIMTSPDHQSGSDRIAEVVQNIDIDVVVNVQGDEPFILKETLQQLVDIFKNDIENQVHVATLKEKITSAEIIQDPNNVKVVTDNQDFALYFSRSPIPFDREKSADTIYYKHIGIYAYRKEALMEFTRLKPGILEQTEKLEQLRYLENGFRIKVAETQQKTIGIDTEQDLINANLYLKQLEQ